MRILIDTNVFIAAESMDAADPHPFAPMAAELYRLAAEAGHQLLMSQESQDDITRQAHGPRRITRQSQFGKYATIPRIALPNEFATRAGYRAPLSDNDRVDLSLLLAIDRNAAEYLVTQDRGLLSHAARAGLGDRVYSLDDIVAQLRAAQAPALRIPAVTAVKGFQLDPRDPIFNSLREAYEGRLFDAWLREKVQREGRDCLVMVGTSGGLDAVVILNEETEDPRGLTGRVLKICTFKVADHAIGVKRGEHLLKSVFRYAHDRHFDAIFVEAVPDRDDVLFLFGMFGFEQLEGLSTRRGELVLAKRLRPTARNRADMDPLTFHTAFGPPALKVESAFVVPVLPIWHDRLFPEAAAQHDLFPGESGFGNALRKAYLSQSSITRLRAGDTVLFYRTHQAQAVTVVGVIEQTYRSSDPTEILAAVGTRTVYPPEAVDAMCQRRAVLAVLFRQDRVLSEPWPRPMLVRRGVISWAPQSISSVRGEGLTWVRQQLLE